MADKEQITGAAIALADAVREAEARVEAARRVLNEAERNLHALIRAHTIVLYGHDAATKGPDGMEKLAVGLELEDAVKRHGSVTAARRRAILAVLETANGKLSPAEIAKAAATIFNIQLDKWALRDLLSDMTRDGSIVKAGHGEYQPRMIFHRMRGDRAVKRPDSPPKESE